MIPITCSAWGPEGHHYVAEIAKLYLDKGVEEKVQKVLGSMTFDEAALWMDEIKKDHAYDNMKPWHYINIDKDKTYVKTDEGNVVNELEKSIAKLNNKKDLKEDEINLNVKIVFHLVADLHMPLHDGYGSDRGGNDIKVDFLGAQKNLHYIWDMGIIEYKKVTVNDCIKAGTQFSKAEIKELQKIDVVKWMEQSRSYLKDVYDFKDNTLTEEYITKSVPIIEKQIFIAGIRLAAVLNQAFGK
jgi:hypothetical protein